MVSLLSLSRLWFALVGAAVGSFLNVVIYRLPAGLLINLPSRSMCPSCKRKLSWFENVPVLSFVFLRGRCRGCHTIISWRYPFIEILTAVMFVAIFNQFGLTFTTFYYLYLASILIAVTFIDLDHRIIPDVISFPSALFGFVGSFFVPELGWMVSLQGLLLGGAGFWLLGWTYYRLTGREGLGQGDMKLLAVIGSFVGPAGVLMTIVLSSFIGSVVGISIILVQRKDLKYAIPFGPFLALGALIYLFWGDLIEMRFLAGLYG